MKNRSFLFTAGFILGLLVGFFVAQEEIRSQLKSTAIQVASSVDKQLRQLLQKARGSGKSTASTDSANHEAVAPSKPPPPDKSSYIREHLLLSSVQAKIDPESGNVAVISGHIENLGDWILKSVSVTAYFMSESEIVFDRSIPIIRENPFPGGTEKDFEVIVSDVPGTWSGGRVRAAITDIEFTD